jgi:hypothetical protein
LVVKIVLFRDISDMKLFEMQFSEQWDNQLQTIIDFIITETSEDTFIELAGDIREYLIYLVHT